jgi:hypothetical protein
VSEPFALERFVSAQVLALPPGVAELAAPYLAFFRERYGDKLAALIFYGSCLSEATRSPTSTPDFFVITDDGALPAHSRLTRLLHPLLPPASQSARLPAEPARGYFKYVYLDLAQLEALCAERPPDLFAAGRLSKRVALVFARDRLAEQRVGRALAGAVISITPIALALLPPRFDLGSCVAAAVGLSYRGEVRLEVAGKVEALIRAFPDHYQTLYRLALADAADRGLVCVLDENCYESLLSPAQREAALRRLARSRRRAVLRWPKVLLTMEGWSEAVLQKLERMDPSLKIPERHRRHPFVFSLPYLLMLLRKGYLRTQRGGSGRGRWS